MTRKRPERRSSLSGLLGEAQMLTQAGQSQPLSLSLQELHRYEGQPRRTFPDDEIEALAQSIRERGILQPLLVRPDPSGKGYEIAAGERRFRAAQRVGLSEVPVLIRHFSDLEMLEVGLLENLQREGLNVIDEVDAKLRLVALVLGSSVEEARASLMSNLRRPDEEWVNKVTPLFAMLGKESWQSFAKNKVRVLGWPEAVLTPLRAGEVSYGQAAVIAAAQPEQHAALLALAIEGASVSQLREWLKAQSQSQGKHPTVKPPKSSSWQAQAEHVRQFLDKGRLEKLSKRQQQELEAWLSSRPGWLQF